MRKKSFTLFSVIGIEMEYMIVDKKTLDIHPMADELLKTLAGKITNAVTLSDTIAADNELALHVIELKTNGPKTTLHHLDKFFHLEIKKINKILKTYHACLMPTGAHPWFNPHAGIQLWPHGNRKIYQAYHRIFNCEGHGWTNLQSTHINLPFKDDEEFSKLHNAIRLLLPIVPALTASTPFIEGKKTKSLDTRLTYYGKNQKKIPIISGDVIPEFIQNRADYENHILKPMYQAVAPYDPEGTLQYEWLNSRGAIARFDRSAIEIRIVDLQECPAADIACAAGIIGVLRYIIDHTTHYLKNPMHSPGLRIVLNACVRNGMKTMIKNKKYVAQFNCASKKTITACELWQQLFENASAYIEKKHRDILDTLILKGNLAERMISACGNDINPETLKALYTKLCDCLNKNKLLLL